MELTLSYDALVTNRVISITFITTCELLRHIISGGKLFEVDHM